MESTTEKWGLHPKLINVIHDLELEPTALLTTVLTRTTSDFADVLVDGRCATGSLTVGTAEAIWLNNCYSANTPGAESVPLYKTSSAVRERQVLVTLYAVHCLLTNMRKGSKAQRGEVAGGGARGVEVSVLVAASDSSVGPLYEFAQKVCSRCEIEVSLTRHDESFADALAEAIRRSKVRSVSIVNALSAPAVGNNRESVVVGVLLVATLKNFLRWNAVDFGYGLVVRQHAENGSGGNDNDRPKVSVSKGFGVVPHISALVAEDIGGLHPRTVNENSWHDILGGMLNAAERAHMRSTTAEHLLPHFMWICLGPLCSLSPLVRSWLSRRNRRYYPLLPNSHISNSMALSGPGTTSHMASTQMRYLLYLDEKDRDEQLHAILKQTHVFRRALLLTHHKDIRQLSGKIQATGLYDIANSNPSLTTSSDFARENTAPTTSCISQVNSTECRQFYIMRSDSSDRQHHLLLSFARSKSQDSILLIGYDTCTAVDLMDTDVLIQYYPPQKSLSDQEWAEFIQILHTTGDGELAIESILRSNPNNSEQHIKLKMLQLRMGLSTVSPIISSSRPSPVIVTFISTSDFSLCTHFIQQYHYSGGTGLLSPAAASSLLSAVTTAPGQPGVWFPNTDPAHLPILNICASHPLFARLVTGVEEERVGNPTDPQTASPAESAATIHNVLKVKLEKEQEILSRGGARSVNGPSGSNGNAFSNTAGARNNNYHALTPHSILNSVMTNATSLSVPVAASTNRVNLPLSSQVTSRGPLVDGDDANNPSVPLLRKTRRGNRSSRGRGSMDRKTAAYFTELEAEKPSTGTNPAPSLATASRPDPADDLGRDKSGSSNENISRLNKDAGGGPRHSKGGGATRRGGKRKSRNEAAETLLQTKATGADRRDNSTKKDEEPAKRIGASSTPPQKASSAANVALPTVMEATGDESNKQSNNASLGVVSKKKSTAHVVGGMLEKMGVKARVESTAGA